MSRRSIRVAFAAAGVLLVWAQPSHAAPQSGGDLPVIAIGESATGTLSASSPRSQAGGRFQAWQFEASAGDRLAADAKSSAFDTYLVLARLAGGITEVVREDDDGGEGTDARILHTFGEDGTYVLVVRSWSDEGLGTFTLSLADRGPAPPPVSRPLPMGERMQGRIDPDGATFLTDWDDEIPFDFWTFDGNEGDAVQIGMEADQFDSYLELGILREGVFEAEASDDDGGEGRNALLRHRLTRTGTHVIRARPLGAYLSDGAYAIELSPWIVAEPVRRPLEPGQVADGEITSGDAILPEGPYFQEWVYEARGGERVRIRMRSDDLDSYLSVGWEDDAGQFVEAISNDDAPDDGLNSLVELTLDRAGPWIVRTRPLSQGSVGRYTVQLEVVEPS
jgi:hypothetical protein